MSALSKLIAVETKLFLREPVSLFFVFALPIGLMLVFGLPQRAGTAADTFASGPAEGPYSVDALRARAVAAAAWAGDSGLADELREVCCWAPAATAIRARTAP